MFEIDTSFLELARDIRSADTLVQAMVRGDLEMVAAYPMYGATVEQRLTPPGGPFFMFRELGERNARVITECGKRLLPPEDVDIRATAWGTAISFFVSNALADFLTP